MSDPKELSEVGLKATMPRMRVLEAFHASKERHLSAEDVYRVLLAEHLDIGLATVYRVLSQFEAAGILKRNHFESGKALYELNEGTHHDHLVCLDCGQVTEFYDADIEHRQEKVAHGLGFEIREHSLSVYAVCVKPRCRNKPRG